MTQIKEDFSSEANVTNIPLKVGNFPKKYYWDFLSILTSDDFLLSQQILIKNNDSDPTIILVEQILEKSEVGSDLEHPSPS